MPSASSLFSAVFGFRKVVLEIFSELNATKTEVPIFPGFQVLIDRMRASKVNMEHLNPSLSFIRGVDSRFTTTKKIVLMSPESQKMNIAELAGGAFARVGLPRLANRCIRPPPTGAKAQFSTSVWYFR